MKRAPSIVAPVALSLVLVATACGGADDAAESTAELPTPVATTPAGANDLRTPKPVEVVRGSSGESGAAAETAIAVESDVAGGGGAVGMWEIEYVVGDGMPDLPSDDIGYVFDGGADVSAERVAEIAAALGVSGEPVAGEVGSGTSWRVGSDDGSGPSLWVYDDGRQAWNFNGSWADEPIAGCAVSVDPDGNESGACPELEPPVGVPSAEEAEQRAADLLVAFGVDPTGLSFESFADDWFASVDANDGAQGADGRTPVRSWNFEFGAEGALLYANGALATPSPVGPYPLVDLDTAVARLSSGFLGGYGGVDVAVPEPAVVGGDSPEQGAETEPAVGEAEPAVESVEPEQPAEEPPIDIEEPVEEPVDPIVEEPMPIEPVPEGGTVAVTLVDVSADLWWAWDVDGVVWLLPAYRFIDTGGAWYVVPAVTDEFLIQVAPGDVELTPLPEPALPPKEPVEAPLPDAPDVVEPDEPADPADAIASFEDLVGLSLEEFTTEAAARGYDTRVVRQDGEFLPVTADYSESRVNVAVEGPRVVAVESIG